jgi:hypothetical protein
MQTLPVQLACQLSAAPAQTPWLIQDLWTDQAVGILGGEPKCCKSFLALDVALCVASGAACLRRFKVARTGPVLLFPAEDSLCLVRQRLEGIALAAGVALASLPLHVITASSLRLDLPTDRQRLTATVQSLRPVLLVLDPLIRLHQRDENEASQIAPLLGFLRQLQRQFELAVLLVHHAKKDAAALRPGQALRGSSDLHGWGDSNLYLRRQRDQLTLTAEHRGAAGLDPIPVQLRATGPALALSAQPDASLSPAAPAPPLLPEQRVLQALQQVNHPLSVRQLRERCRLRTATVCAVLKELCQRGQICRQPGGYRYGALLEPQPVSAPPSRPLGSADLSQGLLPLEPAGNGNGKRATLCFSGG